MPNCIGIGISAHLQASFNVKLLLGVLVVSE